MESAASQSRRPPRRLPEQFLILVTCADERHQVELLARPRADVDCKALLS